MRRVRRLRAGDRIAVVAPASSFPHEELTAGIAELSSLGFEAVYEPSIFDKSTFTAGSAATRAAAIHAAWSDSSIAALVAVRGGYGSAELLPLLDTALLRRARKALIGYSDITALLNLYARCGVVGIHGPMLERRLSLGPAAYDRASFLTLLTSPEPAGDLRPEQLDTFQEGVATGPLFGGTIAQLTAMLGTPWAFDPPKDCILFLEDVGERPYRIHRMLTQLAHAGVLACAKAIVFGEFPRFDEPGGQGPFIRDVLRDFTRGFPGPVVFNFPSGHTTGPTWTLPFGVRAEVTGGAGARLTLLEPAAE